MGAVIMFLMYRCAINFDGRFNLRIVCASDDAVSPFPLLLHVSR